MKKIAFFNHTSDVSGAEISLLLTARHLTKVTPVLFAPEGELLERARAAGMETAAVRSGSARLSRNPLRLAFGMLSLIRGGLAFADAVSRSGAELIHANSLRAGIMASLFAWRHRLPVVWHVRDMAPGGMVGAGIKRLARRRSKGVIAISESVAAGFRGRLPEERLHTIHNGVELRPTTAKERAFQRKKLRFEFGTPEGRGVIALIGQITPWKRQEDAIRALRRIAERGHDVELWIVGEAKFREENVRYLETLKRTAEEMSLSNRIIFTGFRQDVPEICSAADLLLLCSDREPFGRVLIEAMSQHIPVVATHAGGVPEIVTGDCGITYPVGDIGKLTDAVDRILASDSLRQAMGEAGSRRVEAHFTIERTASRVEAVYEQVLGVSLEEGHQAQAERLAASAHMAEVPGRSRS